MLVSEFKAQGSPPPLPASLADHETVEDYIVNLVAHAYYTAIEIDNETYLGRSRQQRMFNFRANDFLDMTFAIRIPTRHRYQIVRLS